MPKFYNKRALKTMKLTMNSKVSVSKTTTFFSWISEAIKKVASIFKKKKEVFDKELSASLQVIEWRTKYDQQRIIHYIYTATLIERSPELSEALGVSLPRFLKYNGEINSIKTDNSIERKLFRWLGVSNPQTKKLLAGEKTANQIFCEQNKLVTNLFPKIVARSSQKNTYEQQILSALTAQAIVSGAAASVCTEAPEVSYNSGVNVLHEMSLVVEAIQVALDTTPKITEFIEVAAETLSTETVVGNATVTDTKPSAIANNKKSINELTIKELKVYAKARGIRIPGSATKIRKMKEIVVTAQNGSTKIIK